MVGHDAPNALERDLQWLQRQQVDNQKLIGHLVSEVNRLHREIKDLLERLTAVYKEIDGEPRKG